MQKYRLFRINADSCLTLLEIGIRCKVKFQVSDIWYHEKNLIPDTLSLKKNEHASYQRQKSKC